MEVEGSDPTRRRDAAAGRAGATASRVAIGLLSVAAGVVHLVMVPDHAGEWFAEGIGFAVVGWVQLATAALVVGRCRRWVLWAVVAVNLAAVAMWAVSRTSGFPVGPESGHAETVGLVDVFTVAAEALAVALALALVVRREVRGGLPERHTWAVGLGALAVAAVTTMVLSAPSARTHAHDAHGDDGEAAVAAGHDHADDAPDAANAAPGAATADTAPTAEPGGHAHDTTVAGVADASAVTPSTGDGHDHPQDTVAAADDKGFSLLMNGHQHTQPPEPMDPETTALLAHQLARTAELVALFPTVADAEAAGYRRSGPFSPGLGAHYGKGTTIATGVIDDTNVLDPMLIYGGTDPDAQIVGFMYNAFGTKEPPEGFAGPNDIWHYHTNVCLVVRPDGSLDAPLGADAENIDRALCDEYGGFVIDNTGYMAHVWTVPGWENPLGVFHETHPGITCPDGTYWQKPMDGIGSSLTTCLGEP